MRSETTFAVPKMDCPSEEQLIRMALASLAEVESLRFNFDHRTVVVVHRGSSDEVQTRLESLGLGARFESRAEVSGEAPVVDPAAESRVLKQLLAINGAMFVVELTLGWVAHSTGLIADSMDMLADAWCMASRSTPLDGHLRTNGALPMRAVGSSSSWRWVL